MKNITLLNPEQAIEIFEHNGWYDPEYHYFKVINGESEQTLVDINEMNLQCFGTGIKICLGFWDHSYILDFTSFDSDLLVEFVNVPDVGFELRINGSGYWLWVSEYELNTFFEEVTAFSGLKFLDLSFNSNFGNSLSCLDLLKLGEIQTLEGLIIQGNSDFDNITELKKLPNLRTLYLCGMEGLSDLTPLFELVNLTSFVLDAGGGSGVTDLSPLSNLKSLFRLSIESCRGLEDIAPITSLTVLTDLRLRNLDRLDSIHAIASLNNLVRLDISSCNTLVDITPLMHLYKIEYLDINSCAKLVDLSPLRKLSNLNYINICSCSSVVDISSLSELPAWKNTSRIDLSNCYSVTSLATFKELKNLRSLNLVNCKGIKNLNDVAQIPSLEVLELYDATISDIQPISELSSLRTLRLSFCKEIEDFSPIAELVGLHTLNLSSNMKLKRIDWMHKLNSMVELDLSGCQHLIKVFPISRIKSLRILNVSYCPHIRDLQSLSGCENLRRIESDNTIEALEVLMATAFTRKDTNYIKNNIGLFIENLELSKSANRFAGFILNCLFVLELNIRLDFMHKVISSMRTRGLQSDERNDLDAYTWETWCKFALELDKADAISCLQAAVNELDIERESEVIMGPVIIASSEVIERHPKEKELIRAWVNEQLQILENHPEEQRQIAPSAAVFFASLNQKDDVLFWLQKATDAKAPLWRDRVLNALVKYYAKKENFTDARRLLDEMQVQNEKDQAIATLAQFMAASHPVEASFLLDEIQEGSISSAAARQLLQQPSLLLAPQVIYQLLLHLQSNPDELASTLEMIIERDTVGSIAEAVKQLFIQTQASGPSAAVMLELCKHPVFAQFVKAWKLEELMIELAEAIKEEKQNHIHHFIDLLEHKKLIDPEERSMITAKLTN